ncbi:MAG: hypothetical protein KIT22_03970 [Verrucomicrobiae bacterium]|nr:hypothetical protein [Verrucomicrobiae bacterium]
MEISLRYLLPAWIGCVLLPLPAIVFWRGDYGRGVALGLFFIGCASLVAYAFRQETSQKIAGNIGHPARIWRKRMKTVGAALFAAFGLFSLLLLFLSDAHDFVAVFLAFLLLIPSLCIVPHFTIATRKPLAAVVFTLFAVFCMKLLGCIVVVLVYGWDASEHGHTTMPWTHPNLLVWLFWFFTGILSLLLYFAGERRFCKVYDCAA